MVLCFGFVPSEQCLHSTKASSFSHSAHPASGLGVCKELGGGTVRTADPKWRWDSPCHRVLCAAVKAEERRRKQGLFGVMAFALPSNHYVRWSPDFQEAAGHLPADRKHWMNSFLCFVCACSFASLIKLSSSEPVEFSHLCSSKFSPPSHCAGSEQPAIWTLLAADWDQLTTVTTVFSKVMICTEIVARQLKRRDNSW